jgi:putative ABC transport system permease protein
MSIFSAARTRLTLLFARRAAESRADQEIDFHIEMETARLVREERLSHDEARRRALAAFGGVTRHKETLRDGHGLAWLGGFSLDMKLGVRMLRKYPGLTFIGGLAMAFAIWVGAVIFQVLSLFVHPTLPLPDGDRIVQVGNWDLEASDVESRAMHEFFAWRSALTSVTDLGAYRDLSRNLITADGDARGVAGAEVTATAFRIAPTPPLLGRVIQPADEAAGAPPVVVLGYELWRNRFASDRGVIGRSVALGEERATVVGVMPEGFAFPVAHELWTQLRPDALDRTPRAGPSITIFGKLAPGVSIDEAQAELTTLGRRAATEFPTTHARLEPRVGPYAEGLSGTNLSDLTIMGSIYFFALLLVVLVCSNVALLIFARAATREGELVVRSALGADRSRIVMQLFAEALVLGGVAAVVGLIVADYALRTWAVEFLTFNIGALPFWYTLGLAPMTVAYALGLTVLAAVIAGVMPALKITRGLGSRLKQGTAGGGGVQFGGVWTAVIIAQVAVTVAFPSVVAIEQRELRRVKSFDIGFAAREYLGVLVDIDDVPGASADTAKEREAQRARYGAALEELRRRVAAEPGVTAVTFIDRLPRLHHYEGDVEVDFGGGVPRPAGLSGSSPGMGVVEVSTAAIDPSYFAVLNSPMLAGRAFDAADAVGEPRVVIVDQAFVDQVMQGRNAIGRRLRYVNTPRRGETEPPPSPWFEIVGVVRELGMTDAYEQEILPGVYWPTDLVHTAPMHMVVHAPQDPMSLIPRVREITAAIDPMLRLSDFQRLDQVADSMLWIIRMWLRVSVLLTAIAVLLSLAGIYAVLSYTVARRTREIGVRVALGASSQRLIVAIFRRPLTHVTLGVLAGTLIIVFLAVLVSGGDGGMGRIVGGFSLTNVALLLGYATFMLAVCLLACVVPTWRALNVEPTEALRAE